MSIGLWPMCQSCFYDSDGNRVGWCRSCLQCETTEARYVERANCSSRIRRIQDIERNSILKRTLQAAIDAVDDYNEKDDPDPESFKYVVSRA